MIARRFRFRFGGPLAGCLALALSAAPAPAQVSSASTAALGMGENYTAAARGIDAVAWNPAALGLLGRGPSFTALAIRGATGLGPVSLGDLSDWSNTLVPAGVKQDWLNRIRTDGGQAGTGGGDVTWLALRLGPLALHASSTARALADVSPGIAELILFGNVGQNGEASRLDLSGSDVDVVAYSAVGASFAQPIVAGRTRLSLGVTVKYVVGHALALGEESSGATTVDPLAVQFSFPLVHTDVENDAYTVDNGHGVGVDVGASLQSGDWTLSGVVQNVTNGFAWDPTRLRYRPLAVALDQDTAMGVTDAMAFAGAPAALQQRIADLTFQPAFAAGVAYQYAPDLLFTADARFASEDGIRAGPVRHIGGGVEFSLVDWLPMRFGGAMVSMGGNADGWQAGAGLGLDLGGWSMSASALRRSVDRFGSSTVVMVKLFGNGH
jgi:hypothetical protein